MQLIRRLLEGFSFGGAPKPAEGRVAVPTIRGTTGPFGWSNLVKGRHGHFLVNPLDIYVGRSLLIYGEFSEAEVELFAKLVKPGDTVLEVGANLGAHTVPLAKMVGDHGAVVALEPQRLIYLALCANLVMNGIRSAKPLMVAAAESGGRVINVPAMEPYQQANFGALELRPRGQEQAEGEPVAVHALDEWGLESLQLLKVDVEGMEPEVIRGAAKTIRRCRPALYVEADRDNRCAEILALLKATGYQAWWHFPPLYNPSNFARQEVNVFDGIVSINLLALPLERTGEGEALLPGHAVVSITDTWRQAHKRLSAGAAGTLH